MVPASKVVSVTRGQPPDAKRRLGHIYIVQTGLGSSIVLIQADARLVLNVVASDTADDPFSYDVSQALISLWADTGVQEAFARRNQYQLAESTK